MNSVNGLDILVRTMSRPTLKGRSGAWQYHPRSDHHSKVACWGILFDLLQESSLLRDHAEQGKIAFGINHEMSDFRSRRKKNLDLVIATPDTVPPKKRISFADLVGKYDIQLSREEAEVLRRLPALMQRPVGTVRIALEAKACMTEHLKARPRLFDELNSSHDVVHGSADMAIAAGFAMVNIANRFVSPTRGQSSGRAHTVTQHDQPRVTELVIQKLLEIPRRSATGVFGFDALAIGVVDCVNDGSPVRLIETPPAPASGDPVRYESMVARVVQLYESRFPHE
jgi:hypothetical protein